MTLTSKQVLAVLDSQPRKIGEIGLLIVGARGSGDQPIGQFLAARGLSLSALQGVVDALVRSGAVVELRGSALWDQRFPGLGPDARGRHFAKA
jgi:hypothetical protein